LEHHNQLLAGLRSGDLEQFRAETQYFLESAASVHDYATQPEAFYHGFMLALIASLMDDFYVFSNAESGHGRPDVILIPKDKTQHQAFIFEFKIVTADQETHKTAEYQRVKSMGRTKTTKKHAEHQHAKKLAAEALDQIKSKHYAAKIRQYDQITDVLLIGVVFEGKTVHCVSEMTDLKK
jgi:hypothetical protein